MATNAEMNHSKGVSLEYSRWILQTEGLLLRYQIRRKVIFPNKRHDEVGEDTIKSFGS